MHVKKVLNNNVVISEDSSGKEVVVMGKGLGFQLKTGMILDNNKVEKVFTLEESQNSELNDNYFRLLKSIPIEILLCTENIIDLATSKLENKLHPSIRISLADHLYFAVERCVQGKKIENPMLWEIKSLYSNEFKVGLQALDVIKNSSGIHFPEDEAGFIALHFVNAQLNDDMKNTLGITNMIRDIVNLIKYNLNLDINDDSISYQRLLTHLKFFAHRIMHSKEVNSDDDMLFQSVKSKYKTSFNCTQKIYLYIEENFSHTMTKEEMMFLTIHIERVRRQED
ncbi:BglG family transcription antiterminator LicT [Vibrio alginolyticus]